MPGARLARRSALLSPPDHADVRRSRNNRTPEHAEGEGLLGSEVPRLGLARAAGHELVLPVGAGRQSERSCPCQHAHVPDGPDGPVQPVKRLGRG